MKHKIIILSGVIIISFFGFSSFCNAAAIITDNFNSYPNGNLNGQGKWIGSSATVQNTVVYEGAKAVKIDSSNGGANMRTLGADLLNDGLQTIYIKTNGDSMWIRLREGNTSDTATQKAWVSINADVAGKIAYYNLDTFSWVALADFSVNTWYAVQIQWRSFDHKVRYNINGGAWSPYVTTSNTGPWVSGLNVVYIQTGVAGGTGNFGYVDTVQENPVISKTPVLIVPGVIGTELEKGQELLWANIPGMITSMTDDFMDPLAFNNDLIPIEQSIFTTNVIGKKSVAVFTFDYTGSLMNEFINQGYIENETLFTFPYDWRYGVSGKYVNNKTNVDLLAQKIQDILTQTGSGKVDVVAHSQGGLVVKKYVIEHPNNHYIGKAVFVGVPNTGAIKSIKTLLEGDNLGMFFLSRNEIKKISENMPAGYDLLPSQKYYDVMGSFLQIIDEGRIDDFDVDVKDFNYNEFKDFLTNDHSLNSLALTNAGNLHTQNFDDFDLRTAGVDLYAIDGCKAGTIGKIIENRYENIFGQSFTKYKAPKFTPGDGTVPLESATNLPIDQNHKFYSLTGEHSKMMSQNGSRQEIVNLISGSNLTVDGTIITQNINECKLNGKAISVFSPIDILVTDQNGNRLGNDGDGNILSEIPNAAFEIMGEHKFLYLPTDDGQTYNIAMQGTGTGIYTINGQNIVNGQINKTEVFSNLPVTAELTGRINLGQETTLTVKQTPNSQDETIFASSVLDATQTEDFASPFSVATLSGTAGQAGFYRSDVSVSIHAQDPIIQGNEGQTTGVLSLTYKIDNGEYQKVLADSAELNLTQEGAHTMLFFATDKAGNNEPERTINFTIDKIAPEVIVEFDPVAMDLKFTGSDNISDAEFLLVADDDDTITITDHAGNITEIKLKDKDRKKGMKAEIESLKYNGLAVDINKNKMKYKWSLGENGNLKELTQEVKSKKEYHITAEFDGINTQISGQDYSGNILESFSGLKIVKITTNEGDFEWGY